MKTRLPAGATSGLRRVGAVVMTCGIALVGITAGTLVANRGTAPATRSAAGGTDGNLLSTSQSSFGTSTGGWVAMAAILGWIVNGDGATGALSVKATSSSAAGAASGTPSAGGLTPADPGLVYTASVEARSIAVPLSVEPVIAFYGSSGQSLGAVFGPLTAAGDAWTGASLVAAVAPPTTAYVSLGLDVPNPSAGDEVDFDDAWIKQTSDGVAPVDGPLHTSGNQIIDAQGHQVALRGVVLDGLEYAPTSSEVTQEAVLQAKVWGANFVRVPLGEQFWLSSNCDYAPGYQNTVDQVVKWITSLGMVALLDLHTVTVGGCEAGGQHNMADQAQAPEFWSQVASRYGSNPLVAFDLYNEPHDVPDSVWLNGGTTTDYYAPYQSYQAAGMQQLYDAVRETGAKNLVFVSGLNWANTPPSRLIDGTNIVYAAHYYTCLNAPPPECSNPDPDDPAQGLNQWVGFSGSQPVAVTEFGWPSPDNGTYNSNVISFAQSHGWSWSVFSWVGNGGVDGFDVAAWWSDGVAEPVPSGTPVLCALAAAASGTTPCSPPPMSSAQDESAQEPATAVEIGVRGTARTASHRW